MQSNKPSEEPLSSPYGPFHEKIDAASGGTDSSPLESLSSDERHEAIQAADAERAKRARVIRDGRPE